MSSPHHPPADRSPNPPSPAAKASSNLRPHPSHPASKTSSATDSRTQVAVAFGRTVRAARRAYGITQETLATRAHLDRTYPSLLERGLRTPTLTSLFAISRALNMHPSTLVADAWNAYQNLESIGAPAAPERVLETPPAD